MPIQFSGSTPGYTLDRIHAALEGRFSPSDLEDDEQIIFYDLLARRHDARKTTFSARLLQEAGNVGYDEAGNLVRTLGDGKVEIIEPATVADGLKTK